MNTYRVLLRTEGEEDKVVAYTPTMAGCIEWARMVAKAEAFSAPEHYARLLVEKVEITIDEDTFGVCLDYLYVKLLPVKAWTVTPTCRLKPCPLVVRERYMTGYPAPTSQQEKY